MPNCMNPLNVSKALNHELHKAGINTKLRIAAFLAQCGHESSDFNRMEENLNYSAKRLRQVFPKHFPNDQLAEKYAGKPDLIANKVYANRMGNGDEESGDGYRYKGRGIIMLTGKEMYNRFSNYINMEKKILQSPELLCTPEYAVKSSTWFWSVYKDLNKFADKSDMITITKYINGGDHGIEDRVKRYKKALSVLG